MFEAAHRCYRTPHRTSEGDDSCARASLPRSVSDHRRRTIAVDVAALAITANELALTWNGFTFEGNGLALTLREVPLTRRAFESTCHTFALPRGSFASVRNSSGAVRRGLRFEWARRAVTVLGSRHCGNLRSIRREEPHAPLTEICSRWRRPSLERKGRHLWWLNLEVMARGVRFLSTTVASIETILSSCDARERSFDKTFSSRGARSGMMAESVRIAMIGTSLLVRRAGLNSGA
jgi:hypothetical protein